MRLRHTAFLTLLVCLTVFTFIRPAQTANSPLIISEFRFRGPSGPADEFIEIYNNTDEAHVVTASDGSSGYGVFASDGIMRFFIPNGTVIPARGHYLGANSVALPPVQVNAWARLDQKISAVSVTPAMTFHTRASTSASFACVVQTARTTSSSRSTTMARVR